MKNELGSDATAAALTPRELQCIAALAEGLTSDAIARRLSISVPTVAMHLTNARNKLQANTREHAVAIAVRKGLIE